MKLTEHEEAIKKILKALGEDPKRPDLIKTPKRFLEGLREMMSGYNENLDALWNGALFEESYDDMVVVRNIEFYSLCEHHVIPFYGRCHIGYIPDRRIVGLSKIPRIVDVFARRLQVQERLTHQIGEALMEGLKPKGLGVVMEAYHLCMMMRGVQKQNSFALTSFMGGSFRDVLQTREEFVAHVHARAFE
ncbi:MAG: GTP cyclohydrolase I FolE [Deltaproteobacteria bacterium]|nr:GTP cyclohydrolase I FolE [Deltaproteobacteria bacterium]